MSFINAAAIDLAEPEYRAQKRWSVSQLKLLPYRPEKFYGQHITGDFPFKVTAGMMFGTQVHAEFLEGKECHEVEAWALTSNGQRRGKNWEAWKAGHAAIDCLSKKEMLAVREIRKSILAQPKLANLLWGDGPTEFSINAVDEETGLPVMSRLDKIRVGKDGSTILVDLKITAVDVDDERKVIAQCLQMGYHRPLAFYGDMMESLWNEPPIERILILGQATPPFVARAWSPGAQEIDLGRRLNRMALCDLQRRLATNNWSGDRHDQISYFSYPDYAYDTNTFVGDEIEEFSGFSAPTQGESDVQ